MSASQYQQEISSDHHGLFVFVLDQSGSMAASWPGAESGEPKSEELANHVNQTLSELGSLSVKNGIYKRRGDVVLIGYGGKYASGESADGLFGGALSSKKKQAIPIPDIVDNPLRVHQDGQDEIYVWIEPHAHGGTPMAEGLRLAKSVIDAWVSSENHKDSFPPVVFNITDGAPNDASEALTAAREIQGITTNHGNALLISIHIPDSVKEAICYPSSKASLNGDKALELMFEMSSELPPQLYELAMGAGLPVAPASRLMLANATPDQVFQLMSFGTRGVAESIQEG